MDDQTILKESKIEIDMPVKEFLESQQDFIIISIKAVTICDKCHQRLTWRRTPDYISMRCGCGCRLWYPKDEKGIIITTFVSKMERLGSNGR